MKAGLRHTLLLLCASITLPVAALNYGFMDTSPSGYFTNRDFSIMESTLAQTLNTARDGSKVTWKNPETTAWGYFVVSGTTKKNNMLCRNLKIFSSAKSVNNVSSYTFCKVNNKWRIAN